ncbi:site-specific integrase [Segetibacter aerophilus]|uniref:Integrase n=1 Tax=Segetibacter aerophilus TaxID=670293 RepID=A0A512BA77_9BACT|nr:site-specific integrase [Segetibacter aerophilus]GEO08861.1 integrase [Segetibacter aerophilus]
MGTIRYVLRLDKSLKDGTSPVDLIYQVSGQRRYYRTRIKLHPCSWDSGTQKAVYIDKKLAKSFAIDFYSLPAFSEVEETNIHLNKLSLTIIEIEKRFEMDSVAYSSEMVVEKLNQQQKPATKKEEASNILFDFMQKYIDEHKDIRTRTSISVYKSVKNHLQDYCKSTGKKVTFDNLDYSFFQSFQNFLYQDRTVLREKNGEVEKKIIKGLNNTTVAKQLSTIKTFLNYAKQQGVEVSDKYKDFKIKRESLEVIALTNEEFETLFHMDLSGNKRLANVRDVFCFACVTGLRYSDLWQLKREHIKSEEIRLTVKKTKEILTIPLNLYSRAILKKYEGMLKPLPVISNQNMNYALKDLCKLACIDEQIEIVRFRGIKREAITYPKYELVGVHTGRKTFCTLSLEKGMSAEEVMSISGNLDYRSFKRYVKVTEQRKKVVMVKAWGGSHEENQLKAV